MAKQKALEKKAKTYKLPLGELALFTQQIASLLAAGLRILDAARSRVDAPRTPGPPVGANPPRYQRRWRAKL